MSHLDDDVLAGFAAGQQPGPISGEHLAQCAECRERAESFERLVSGMADAGERVTLESPPEHVWQGIRSEVMTFEGESSGGASGMPEVALLSSRRRKARTWSAGWVAGAAATAGVVGGIGATMWISGLVSSTGETTLASAPLADLATEATVGRAQVDVRGDGTRVLVVDTDYHQVNDASIEVWMIDSAVEGMISLGYLSSDHGEFVIPAGFDYAAYPIVDISIEPNDGNPQHSGVSITRGILGL